MADIKISQLSAAQSISLSDVLPIVSSGVTVKATAGQIKDFSIGTTDISSIGNGTPTGAISTINTSLNGAKEVIANIEGSMAYRQVGEQATKAYVVGEYFSYEGHLCVATAAIPLGNVLVLDSNYEYAPFADVALSGDYNDLDNLPTVDAALSPTSTNAVQNKVVNTAVTSLKEDLFNYKDRMGTVNLLQNTMQSYPSYSGVAVIVDADGVITTSNISTGLVSIAIGEVVLDGTYKISGCPAGGATDTYCLQIKEDGTYLSQYDTGSGLEYTFDKTKPCQLVLVIRSGVNANGLVFKPMITTADTPNSDYAHFVPYSKTNRQLTEDSVDWDDLSEVGAVNLFKYPYLDGSTTSSGIAYVDNGDNSITVGTGTVSSSAASLFKFADAEWIKKYAGKALKLSSIASSDALGNNLVIQGNIQDSSNNILTSFSEVLGTNGVDIILNIPNNAAKIYCQLYIVKNTVISSAFTVKLMLTPVAYNGDYVPYAKTNKELTDDVATNASAIASVKSGVLKLNSYNNEEQLSPNTTYNITNMSGVYLVFFTRAGNSTNCGVYLTQCHTNGSSSIVPLAAVTASGFSLSFSGTTLVVATGSAEPRVRFMQLSTSNY